MIFTNPLLFITFDLGFVTSLFGVLFGLAWLEHPTSPGWWRRLRAWSPRRGVETLRGRSDHRVPKAVLHGPDDGLGA